MVAEFELFSALFTLGNGFHPSDHSFVYFFIFSHGLYFLKIFFVDKLFILPEIVVTILLTIVFKTLLCNSRFKVLNQRIENIDLLFIQHFEASFNSFLFSGIKLSHLFQIHNAEFFFFPDKLVRGLKPGIKLFVVFFRVFAFRKPFLNFDKSCFEFL